MAKGGIMTLTFTLAGQQLMRWERAGGYAQREGRAKKLDRPTTRTLPTSRSAPVQADSWPRSNNRGPGREIVYQSCPSHAITSCKWALEVSATSWWSDCPWASM